MCPTQKVHSIQDAVPQVGVDGCRGGWLAVWSLTNREDSWEFAVFESFADLLVALPVAEPIFVDMPIGLPDRRKRSRQVDKAARRFLGKGLSSRVFSAPARRTLHHGLSYPEALKINREETGVGLSRQSYFLIPKIRQVDAALQSEAAGRRILEAHPETVFAAFNQVSAIHESKKSESGRALRLNLLKRLAPETEALFERIKTEIPRKEAQLDDILDAMVLAMAAGWSNGWIPLDGIHEVDSKNRAMQMCIPRMPERA